MLSSYLEKEHQRKKTLRKITKKKTARIKMSFG